MKTAHDRSQTGQDRRGNHDPAKVSVPTNRLWFLRPGCLVRFLAVAAVIIWLAEPRDGRPASEAKRILGTHPGKVSALAFSPDGRWLASAGYDSPVVLWDMTRRQIARSLEGSPVTALCVAFSPDGTALAAAGGDGVVRIWNTRTWTVHQRLRGNAGSVRSLAFSADGKLLATGGGDCTIRLWDTDTWRARAVLQEPEGSVSFVVFSPSERRLASVSTGERVKLWDLAPEGLNLRPRTRVARDHEAYELSGVLARWASSCRPPPPRRTCNLRSVQRTETRDVRKTTEPGLEPCLRPRRPHAGCRHGRG